MIQTSIIIVNYNTGDLLKRCIKSVIEAIKMESEIIVVNNGSEDDNTIYSIQKEYPLIEIIQNKENIGFSKANNLAIKKTKGKYILLLNPDTIVKDNAIDKLIQFLEDHPDVDACGPKILNSDGTFQPQCKRGFPTPIASLSYFLRLHKLFPRNKTFGKYLLTYLDQDEINEVDALSGACMLIRRVTLEQVGMLDEDYFMYGDDLDLCFKIKKAGWKIFYVPTAEIIHYGGKSTQKRAYQSIYHFYRSAYIFYKRNLSRKYPFIMNWIIYSSIFVKFVFSLSINAMRKKKFAGSKKP